MVIICVCIVSVRHAMRIIFSYLFMALSIDFLSSSKKVVRSLKDSDLQKE